MSRTPLLLASLLLALAAGFPHVATAQPAQRSDDCRTPGGCGTSGKPGGVERAPSREPVEMRGSKSAAPPSERRGVIDEAPSYCDVEPPCPKGCRHDTVNRICLDEPGR